MSDNLLTQLTNLHKLFAEAAPTDPKVINDYAWTVAKQIFLHIKEIDSLTSRQLLADCLKLPIKRPSKLYSALLSAAVKVSATYPDFRFAAFVRMWGIENLRPDDHERQHSQNGKSFPSLAERVAKAFGHSLLLHEQDRSQVNDTEQSQFLSTHGLSVSMMLVTRIKQATDKDGRKLTFVTLTSPEGLEIECVSHALQPSPLHPLPEGKRHYANIGQLYDCLLHTKQESSLSSSLSLKEAYLYPQKPTEVFPTEIGYIESIDQQHGHMHVFDAHSRHFVAPVQRFSRERVGDFIRFIPIIPAASKFKTAIIQGTVPSSSLSATVPSDLSEGQPLLREIRITHINKEKGYAAWELTDPNHPITELLSPLQLSQGETSPTFTTGYLNLTEELSSSLSLSSTLKAFIYLRRGKDRQKRPHVARLF